MRKTLILLLILSGLAFLPARENTAEMAVPPMEPDQAPAVQSGNIVVEGVLEPFEYADLSFENDGRIVEIPVDLGDTVQAGDPLIRLDGVEAELALQQSQARLSTAEAGLAAAQTQLLMAQANIATAEQRVVVAEAQLALAQSGPRPEEIAAAEARLAAAEAGITQAIGSRDAALNVTSDATIRSVEANLAAAVAERQALENEYNTILTTCFEREDGSMNCPLYGPVEESTRARLEAARATEAAAQAALNELLGGPSAAQRAAAGGAVAIAVANRDVAQAQLDLLLAGATPAQTALAEVAVAQAEINVQFEEVSVQEAEAAVSAAEAQVIAAQIAVDAAQVALDQLTLTATFDGAVAEIHVDPGETVLAGVPVITVADFSGWQVRTTDLSELDVARLAPDSQLQVRLDAIPDESLVGTVTKVSLIPDLFQGEVVYEALIRLEPAPALPLRWGMTALVDIE